MREYWKNGKRYDLPDYTPDELAQMKAEELRARIREASRPLTESEILRMTIRRQVNGLSIPDETASRMVEYYPTMQDYEEGALIKGGTTIAHGGVLKRANVDLYNYVTNSPDNAPTLWTDIAYRDGVRVIPDPISAEQAYGLDELGWQDGRIWRSRMDGNVYPVTQTDAWERVS